MKTNRLQGLVQWSLMAALVLGTGAIAQAQQDKDQSQPQGRIVQIGPEDDGQSQEGDHSVPAPQPAPAPEEQPSAASQYWIGILSGPLSPALRSQLDVPDGQGLLVRDVVPDSPAAKAGLKKYDVLLRANDNDLSNIGDLVELVRTTGEQHGKFSLELLRRGQRETAWVTPAERPERQEQPEEFGGEEMPGNPSVFFRRFQMNRPFEFRMFGPGVIVGGGAVAAELPNGVSVVIRKQGDKPAHITVKRGDQTWEITGDDPESLDQLPDDLRPFIERMLHGGLPEVVVPNVPAPAPMPKFNDQRLRKRLDKMQERFEKLQQQIEKQAKELEKQSEKFQQQLKDFQQQSHQEAQ